MLEVAVLVKLRIAPGDVPTLQEYRSKNVRAQKAVAELQALTIWESQSDPLDYLLMIVYPDEAAADEGLKASMGVGALVGSLKSVETAPEVRRGRIEFQDREPATTMAIGAFASVSVRVAEPGRGADLLGELSDIFGELAQIPGYLGSFVCRNEGLTEESIGVVFWKSRRSFDASLPNKMTYQVQIYRRVL
jgi:hypothetical protein